MLQATRHQRPVPVLALRQRQRVSRKMMTILVTCRSALDLGPPYDRAAMLAEVGTDICVMCMQQNARSRGSLRHPRAGAALRWMPQLEDARRRTCGVMDDLAQTLALSLCRVDVSRLLRLRESHAPCRRPKEARSKTRQGYPVPQGPSGRKRLRLLVTKDGRLARRSCNASSLLGMCTFSLLARQTRFPRSVRLQTARREKPRQSSTQAVCAACPPYPRPFASRRPNRITNLGYSGYGGNKPVPAAPQQAGEGFPGQCWVLRRRRRRRDRPASRLHAAQRQGGPGPPCLGASESTASLSCVLTTCTCRRTR
jgi:hypothetical protein